MDAAQRTRRPWFLGLTPWPRDKSVHTSACPFTYEMDHTPMRRQHKKSTFPCLPKKVSHPQEECGHSLGTWGSRLVTDHFWGSFC